jgi:hypothetical protein
MSADTQRLLETFAALLCGDRAQRRLALRCLPVDAYLWWSAGCPDTATGKPDPGPSAATAPG